MTRQNVVWWGVSFRVVKYPVPEEVNDPVSRYINLVCGETTEIILLLSGLLTHRRTVSHCLVCRITVELFLIARAISHNFAQFPGISIHTPTIVWTVESWVFCVWIVWFILPRPQPGVLNCNLYSSSIQRIKTKSFRYKKQGPKIHGSKKIFSESVVKVDQNCF